ncbi:MAG: GTP cyclohydrolase I FolE [Planctomycetota bacterium]
MDKNKLKKAAQLILEGIGEDPGRTGLKETPERFVRMCEEIFAGYGKNPKDYVKIFENHIFDDIVLIKDIDFFSFCEHHLLPFLGIVNIAYIPKNSKITGLSKLPRVVDILSRRLQVQERLTYEITKTLYDLLNPKGIMTIIEAQHFCMILRGVKKRDSKVITISCEGIFKDNFGLQERVLGILKKT